MRNEKQEKFHYLADASFVQIMAWFLNATTSGYPVFERKISTLFQALAHNVTKFISAIAPIHRWQLHLPNLRDYSTIAWPETSFSAPSHGFVAGSPFMWYSAVTKVPLGPYNLHQNAHISKHNNIITTKGLNIKYISFGRIDVKYILYIILFNYKIFRLGYVKKQKLIS